MKKTMKYVAYISLFLAIVALIFKELIWPNQIIILIVAILINNFIVLPVFYIKFIRESDSKLKKIYRIFGFVLLFVFPIAVFMGMQTEFQLAFYLMIIFAFLFIVYILLIEKMAVVFDKQYGFFFQYFFIFISLIFIILPLQMQQADKLFKPEITNKAYQKGKGSIVLIDGGHNNFHQLKGNFWGFAKLLKTDGYQLAAHEGNFTSESLKGCKILVIANALNDANAEDWSLPTPSAFSNEEIEIIRNWVWNGGSLLLIADHMPYGGANSDLGRAFGFELQNGFALNDCMKNELFTRSNQSIFESILTNGRNANEWVDSIVTFTGQAFPLPTDAIPILLCDTCFYQYYPNQAWNFEGLEKIKIEDFAQGAYKLYGDGRVVVFGEAAMFTTQLGLGLSYIKVGMNSPEAKFNFKLVLNIIHWLDGIL